MDAYDFIDRCVYKRFQLDTNRINSRQSIPAVNQLEQWNRDHIIELFISEVAYEEALAGANSQRLAKTMSYYYSESAVTNHSENQRMSQIEQSIFPGGARNQNERNDVEIVFNADKYGAILVTHDGGSRTQPRGILGSRGDLARIGISVMSAEEAVVFVREQLEARDRLIREGCKRFGVALPEWVGKD